MYGTGDICSSGFYPSQQSLHPQSELVVMLGLLNVSNVEYWSRISYRSIIFFQLADGAGLGGAGGGFRREGGTPLHIGKPHFPLRLNLCLFFDLLSNHRTISLG